MNNSEYRQPTHREELERELVHGASSQIAHAPENAAAIAKGIKTVLDELAPVAPHPVAIAPPPALDHGPDSLERAWEYKTYQDGTTAFGPAPLPDVSPALWAKPLAKEVPELTVSLSDLGLEREIQAAGADKAPRVTPADIEANIKAEIFFTALDGAAEAAGDARSHHNRVKDDADVADVHQALRLLTFCVLVLRNGFTVVGHSACASPENYNKEIGQRIARENAEREIWPLLGFRLRDELARPVLTEADAAADLAGTPRPT